MVGIKGQGMTALAEILKARGADVTGSDTMTESFTTDAVLKAARIPVRPFARLNITKKINTVIYSTAYRLNTHPELKEATKKGIFVQSYAEALAELFNSFPQRILVTGTHGKSTTSAMVGYILEQAGYDPTVIIGAEALNWKRNSRAGKSDWIVAEGDEYQAKILMMRPTLLVLTSIDYDHPDFFKTKKDYEAMFKTMRGRLPASRVVTTNSYYGKKLRYLFGSHNQQNAERAARAAATIGVRKSIIDSSLQSFRGVGRRLEYHSDPKAKTVLLDDYAHHPVEIRAALDAVRKRYPRRRIVVVFQPHTFSRTKTFLNDFAISFTDADAVIILETFSSAREKRGPVGAKELRDKIARHHPRAFYAATHRKAARLALRNLSSPGVFLAMGAGDVNRIFL